MKFSKNRKSLAMDTKKKNSSLHLALAQITKSTMHAKTLSEEINGCGMKQILKKHSKV